LRPLGEQDMKNKDNAKILVVDDQIHALKGVSRIMRGAGYETFEASNGTECLKIASEHKPDLILLDVVLPDIDGREVCRRIKSNPQTADIYVVLFSSIRVESDSQAEGLEHGADGYIARPIPNRELLARVKAILRLKYAESQLREGELWMRGIFDSLEESVIILTPDRSIDDVNPATVKIFGYENKDIIGRSTEILHVDHEHFVEFGRRIKESFDRGASAEFEFKAKRANGEIFPTEHTVSLLKDGNGVAIGIVSVVRDITERKRIEEEKEKVLVDLRKALSEVKQLTGFIPICASCKKIRDDKGYWSDVEKYISDHSEALFSHGICPDCMRKLYPELADDVLGRLEKDEKDSKGFYA